jgi:hypothetical protein
VGHKDGRTISFQFFHAKYLLFGLIEENRTADLRAITRVRISFLVSLSDGKETVLSEFYDRSNDKQ